MISGRVPLSARSWPLWHGRFGELKRFDGEVVAKGGDRFRGEPLVPQLEPMILSLATAFSDAGAHFGDFGRLALGSSVGRCDEVVRFICLSPALLFHVINAFADLLAQRI
jgi:hypothetical protein